MNSPSATARLHTDNKFIVLPRFPSACTGLLNRMSDIVWEKRFNLATAGHRDIAYADAVFYEPLPYYALFKVLVQLALRPGDVFVDLGSGMGRAVCVAASFPIRAAVGVEIDSELYQISRANAARVRSQRAPIQLHHQSATDFDYSDATVLTFFNPFGPATMSAVLEKIRASLEKNPRQIRIGYVNAACAHVFATQPWLELTECWEMSNWSRVKTPVKFYRAR